MEKHRKKGGREVKGWRTSGREVTSDATVEGRTEKARGGEEARAKKLYTN